MSEINENGMTLNYEVSGKGPITLVFVHGSYIDQTYWKKQVSDFKDHYQVITLDLPGHGKSRQNRKDWEIQRFADDLIFLIKKLELRNVILIGHSIAGNICLMAAVKYPDPIVGLIGIDTFKNAGIPITAEFKQQTEGIKKGLLSDFADTNEKYARTALLTPSTPNHLVKKVIKDYRNAYPPMGIQTTAEFFEIDKMEKELLPRLSLKLYLINVNYIPTNEAALMQLKGKDYQLNILNGTSHFPMLEHPDELNIALQLDISRIENDIQSTPGTAKG
ncbi:alpha/beta fold hydrolase [Pedobacter hiemivivus]|uniref:Alpha/beta hydrolase n=1 Tax=Pedobacter hiemivivus TaxID=2530454 RepID=A0A4V2MK83_9SPHI|nr:alpha/beta hydrolase [Pedobacter hiemivivus]TCC96966.1 alpha/beta hydrolase [Pedobacter hiemivivus]